jgi:hypothetical protein
MRRKLLISLVGILVVAFGGLLVTVVADNTPALGLDLQGGISVTQQPVGNYDPAAIDLAVERIRDRVDSLGVAEPEIIRQGDAIVVNLPGVKNQQQAIDLVQVTGQVYLRPVLGCLSDPGNTDDSGWGCLCLHRGRGSGCRRYEIGRYPLEPQCPGGAEDQTLRLRDVVLSAGHRLACDRGCGSRGCHAGRVRNRRRQAGLDSWAGFSGGVLLAGAAPACGSESARGLRGESGDGSRSPDGKASLVLPV